MAGRAPTKSNAVHKAGGISSQAVEKATGKSWDQWFKLIDRAGGRTMEHKAIAKLVHEKHGLSGWWSQMVTVGYEQACLGREKHAKQDGYAVSVSRTIDVPLSRLYRAWSDKRLRRRWLPEGDFEIRRATKEKSLRITWIDGVTHVDVNFYGKGNGKSQVTVQHKKLADRKSVDKVKRLWSDRLDALKQVLKA